MMSMLLLFTDSSVWQAQGVDNSPIERRIGSNVQMFDPQLAKVDLKK
jgi:hypothetical protein